MTEPLYWCCAELLALGVRIPQSSNLAPPHELRQIILTALDTMVGRGRSRGFPDTDLAEARYALVAFLDEQINKSNWPGRNEWMGHPLQLELYREYTAGENFFKRMRVLTQQGQFSPALEIYYLCLLLGFRGAFGASGDTRTLNGISDNARQRVAQAWPLTAKLAPRAEPPDRLSARRTSHIPAIATIVGLLVLVVAVMFGFERLLNSDVENLLGAMKTRTIQTESGSD
jgi:type VI secretion system protein ImpK